MPKYICVCCHLWHISYWQAFEWLVFQWNDRIPRMFNWRTIHIVCTRDSMLIIRQSMDGCSGCSVAFTLYAGYLFISANIKMYVIKFQCVPVSIEVLFDLCVLINYSGWRKNWFRIQNFAPSTFLVCWCTLTIYQRDASHHINLYDTLAIFVVYFFVFIYTVKFHLRLGESVWY